MSARYPELKGPMLGLTFLAAPFLWYFDWAGWAWFVVALLYVVGFCSWLSEALKVHRSNQEKVVVSGEIRSSAQDEDMSDPEVRAKYENWDEARDVAESGLDFKTLWQGKKEIRFTYRERGWKKPYEVTATVTKVISPDFGEDSQTYFQGVPAGGSQRYFCLGYLTNGRKVTDPATGDVGTLRKILGVKRRAYQ